MRVHLVTICALVLLCLSPWLAPTEAPAASRCPLMVNDVSSVDGAWPLVGGVPVPRGEVSDPSMIRVVDGAGDEVPAQVDVATTYRDGSVRWALVSMMAPVSGEYTAELGEGVERAEAAGIRLSAIGEGWQVDTGAARFSVTTRNLLPDDVFVGDTRLYGPGEASAFAVDSRGRRAEVAGDAAEIEVEVLKDGPVRSVLRSEGWYIAEDGARVARGTALMEFFAGSPMMKLTHSFVLTEDTNDLWFRDWGVRIPVQTDGAARATLDTSHEHDAEARQVELDAGEIASMVQTDFPHFAERASHFDLTLIRENERVVLTQGEACGEWADLTVGGIGCTIVVRDLAEQFPKEFAASSDAITAHLWSGRSGKAMDFRAETLVEEYWQSWAEEAPGGAEALAEVASNAQAAQKTHELLVMPHAGAPDVEATARRAHAADEPVLLQADPEFVCDSGALPWPLHPKDPGHFPEEEALISDFWERTVFAYRVFPMTGVIAWGMNPYLQYHRDEEGRWQADFYRLSQMVDYGIRRHVWNLYARSGERRYYDYGARFNRFAGDWEMQHVNVEGEDGLRKMRGSFSYGHIHRPFYWGTASYQTTHLLLSTGISGHDAMNWLLEYYMTGDEHALALAEEYADAFREHWDLQTALDGSAPFIILRVLTALYTHDWDERLGTMAHDLAHGLMLPEAPNGFTEDMPYGALYKVDRNASATYDYWWATGDELARDTFLKALDYEYRFNRIPEPIAYQNGKAYLYTLAYEMTGRDVYRRIVAQLVRSSLAIEDMTLEEEIGGADPYELERLPNRPPHLNMHVTLGVPTALTLLAEAEEPIPPYPLLVKAFNAEPARAVFNKRAGQELTLRVYLRTLRDEQITPLVRDAGGQPVDCRVDSEQRIESYAPSQYRHLSYVIAIPAQAPAGTYRLGVGGPEEFIVQQADTERVALHCPEGFWLGAGGPSAGERMYFEVPGDTEELQLFLGRPLTVFAPDGSVAVEASEENLGHLSVPVEGRGGPWSAMCAYPGHIRLENVRPVVAYGTPGRLVEAEVEADEPEPWRPPAADERFVAGVVGRALHLSGAETLGFPRGGAMDGGAYEHFPAREGTVELWFRPNWSSSTVTFRHRQLHHRRFIADRAINFYYRYGQGPVEHNLYSYVDLLTHGALGPGETTGHIGGHARHFMTEGEWVHLAATWRITEGDRGTEGTFTVFVNGRPMEPTWNYPRSLSGRENYALYESNEEIGIGPFDGCIDELRLSNTVRYEEAFEPPAEPLTADERTVALFHFDGDTEGESGAVGDTFVAE